jgi:hypothetical protein
MLWICNLVSSRLFMLIIQWLEFSRLWRNPAVWDALVWVFLGTWRCLFCSLHLFMCLAYLLSHTDCVWYFLLKIAQIMFVWLFAWNYLSSNFYDDESGQCKLYALFNVWWTILFIISFCWFNLDVLPQLAQCFLEFMYDHHLLPG